MLWESKFQTFLEKILQQVNTIELNITKILPRIYVQEHECYNTGNGCIWLSKAEIHTAHKPLANSKIYKMKTVLTVITTILNNVHKLHHISHWLNEWMTYTFWSTNEAFAFALCVWMLAAIIIHDIYLKYAHNILSR